MQVRFHFLLRMLMRDCREMAPLAGALAAIFAVALLVGAEKNPRNALSANGIALAASLSVVATMQFVQVLVLKEKASGAFLLLRSLPVTNDEIAMSKILSIGIGTEAVCLLLLGAIFLFGKTRGLPMGTPSVWVVLWAVEILMLVEATSVGAALAYDQKKAMVVPVVVMAALLAVVAGIAHLAGPNFWTGLLAWRAERWGLLVLPMLTAGFIRVALLLFDRRDFVQLID